MKYLTSQTALQAWDSLACKNPSLYNRIRHAYVDVDYIESPNKPVCSTLDELSSFVKNDVLQPPFDLAVSKDSRRPNTKSIRYHSISSIPPHAFVQLGKDICIATPEYAVCQALCGMERFDAIRLLSDLCGTYSTTLKGKHGNFLNRPALSSIKLLQNFIKDAHGINGIGILRRNIKFIIENAASPQEVIVGMLLKLPMRFGGYNLKSLMLNESIALSGIDAITYSYKNIKPDYLDKKHKVAIEYQSAQWHSEINEMAHDNLKDMIYNKMGYEVIHIYTSDVRSEYAFHVKATDIARAIEKRLHYPNNFTERRAYLRQALLNKW